MECGAVNIPWFSKHGRPSMKRHVFNNRNPRTSKATYLKSVAKRGFRMQARSAVYAQPSSSAFTIKEVNGIKMIEIRDDDSEIEFGLAGAATLMESGYDFVTLEEYKGNPFRAQALQDGFGFVS